MDTHRHVYQCKDTDRPVGHGTKPRSCDDCYKKKLAEEEAGWGKLMEMAFAALAKEKPEVVFKRWGDEAVEVGRVKGRVVTEKLRPRLDKMKEESMAIERLEAKTLEARWAGVGWRMQQKVWNLEQDVAVLKAEIVSNNGAVDHVTASGKLEAAEPGTNATVERDAGLGPLLRSALLSPEERDLQ
ncbi:hypothetical protein MMC18_004010 [Xylographa bjoerkii]|nr:hypothetical protein [Xylographa bjoerkii]